MEQVLNVDFYFMKLSTQFYLCAIERDFRDWAEISKKVLGIIGDHVPVISEMKGLADWIREIAELVSEYEAAGMDYSSTDQEIELIERHISVMELTCQYFSKLCNILKKK